MGRTVKEYPHTVTVKLHQRDASVLLVWLREAGHEIRETMMFGPNHHRTGDDFATQEVRFKKAEDATMFKLAWGGQCNQAS